MAYGKIKADTLVYDNSGSDTEVAISSLGNKANLASPTFTGTPAAPTAAANTNTTQIATTAYVQTELGDYLTTALGAPKASPALTGTATAVNLTLSGDLTVNGTTTTINSTTLAVDDKNIELGTVDTPTDITADGGGITLKGATDKKITWNNAQNSWIFNQDIVVETGVVNVKGVEGGTATIHFNADEGDDNADIWRIQANTSGNFTISTYSTGSYVAGLQVNSNGNIVGAGSISDSKGDVRDVKVNAQGGTHTLVATDAGTCIKASGNVTVPNSVFSQANVVSIINNTSGDLSIIQGSGVTMYNTADAATGNRTLATRGMATMIFDSASVCYISGAGLS